MKNLLLLAVAFTFIFQSCSDDVLPTLEQRNGFTYDGEFYPTDLFLLDTFDQDGVAFLLLGDATYDPATFELGGEQIDMALLEFKTTGGQELIQAGTYTHDPELTTPNSFSASSGINFSESNSLGDFYGDSISGSTTVAIVNDQLEITYSATIQGENGEVKTIQGYYKGNWDYILD